MFSKIFLLLLIVLLEIYTLQKTAFRNSNFFGFYGTLKFAENCLKHAQDWRQWWAMMMMVTFFGTWFLGIYSPDLHQIWYTYSLYDSPSLGQFLIFICPESRRTYITTVWNFFFFPIELKLFFFKFRTPRTKKLQLKLCLSVCRVSVRPSVRPSV